ncbi:hypothetical protein ASC88_13350 [Rhizobacter sp. Root29]|nr:hypothetical protein ASC88_13350 [Rhizobacter sp. Root29]
MVVSSSEVDPPLDPPEDAATGVTLLLADDADPAELTAVTPQVYVVPFVIPVTVIGLLEPVTDRVVTPVAVQSPL